MAAECTVYVAMSEPFEIHFYISGVARQVTILFHCTLTAMSVKSTDNGISHLAKQNFINSNAKKASAVVKLIRSLSASEISGICVAFESEMVFSPNMHYERGKKKSFCRYGHWSNEWNFMKTYISQT